VRIGELKLQVGGDPPPNSLVTVVGSVQVCINVAGAIDLIAEAARIAKALEKTEKERAQVAARLSNASFVERAPAAVVEKERTRLGELEEQLKKERLSLERIQRL
jgi:valyl-tRNA synthetase